MKKFWDWTYILVIEVLLNIVLIILIFKILSELCQIPK